MVDLWPSIKTCARPLPLGETLPGLVSVRSTTRAWAIVLVLTIMAAVASTTPVAQAAVEKWIEQFGIVLVDQTSLRPTPQSAGALVAAKPVPVPVSGQPAALAQRAQYVDLSIAQAQLQFHIRLAAWMPADFSLAGAQVDGQDRVRVQFYRGAESSALGTRAAIGITETTVEASGGYVFPISQARTVQVNRHPSTYVQGAWNGDQTWNDAADVDTLAWQADGVTFMLQAADTGLSRSDIIRIAESLS